MVKANVLITRTYYKTLELKVEADSKEELEKRIESIKDDHNDAMDALSIEGYDDEVSVNRY